MHTLKSFFALLFLMIFLTANADDNVTEAKKGERQILIQQSAPGNSVREHQERPMKAPSNFELRRAQSVSLQSDKIATPRKHKSQIKKDIHRLQSLLSENADIPDFDRKGVISRIDYLENQLESIER